MGYNKSIISFGHVWLIGWVEEFEWCWLACVAGGIVRVRDESFGVGAVFQKQE